MTQLGIENFSAEARALFVYGVVIGAFGASTSYDPERKPTVDFLPTIHKALQNMNWFIAKFSHEHAMESIVDRNGFINSLIITHGHKSQTEAFKLTIEFAVKRGEDVIHIEAPEG